MGDFFFAGFLSMAWELNFQINKNERSNPGVSHACDGLLHRRNQLGDIVTDLSLSILWTGIHLLRGVRVFHPCGAERAIRCFLFWLRPYSCRLSLLEPKGLMPILRRTRNARDRVPILKDIDREKDRFRSPQCLVSNDSSPMFQRPRFRIVYPGVII